MTSARTALFELNGSVIEVARRAADLPGERVNPRFSRALAPGAQAIATDAGDLHLEVSSS